MITWDIRQGCVTSPKIACGSPFVSFTNTTHGYRRSNVKVPCYRTTFLDSLVENFSLSLQRSKTISLIEITIKCFASLVEKYYGWTHVESAVKTAMTKILCFLILSSNISKLISSVQVHSYISSCSITINIFQIQRQHTICCRLIVVLCSWCISGSLLVWLFFCQVLWYLAIKSIISMGMHSLVTIDHALPTSQKKENRKK